MSSEQRYLVLTAVGPDRPGLVQEIAGAVHGAGANLEDSRMAILGGEFAVLLLVTGAPEAVRSVQQDVPALEERLGLHIFVKETRSVTAPGKFLLYRLRVSGVDRPGIVSGVSKVFAGRAINVASLDSRIVYAPLSGTPMFVLNAELQVPSEVALRELRRDLAATCDEENLDFILEGG
jgi:glycine cleavage system transcriptional repressor